MRRISPPRLITAFSFALVLAFLLFSPQPARAAPPFLDQSEIWLGVEGEPSIPLIPPITNRTIAITSGAATVNSVVSANTGVAVVLGWLPGATSFVVWSVADGDTSITVTNPEGEVFLDVHVGLSASVPHDGEIYLSIPGGWGPTYTLTIYRHYGGARAYIYDTGVATIEGEGALPGPQTVFIPYDPTRSSYNITITGVAVGNTNLAIYDHDSAEILSFDVLVVEEEPAAIAFDVTDVTSGDGSAVGQGGRIPVQQFTMSHSTEGASGNLEWIHLEFRNAGDGVLHPADGLVEDVDPSLYDGHGQACEIRRVIVRQVSPPPPAPPRWFYTLYEVDSEDLVVEFNRGTAQIAMDLKVDIWIPPPGATAATWEVVLEMSSLARGFEPQGLDEWYGDHRDKFTQRFLLPSSADIQGPFTGPAKPPPPWWNAARIHVVSAMYDATPTGPYRAADTIGPVEPKMLGPDGKEFPLFPFVLPGIGTRPRFDFSPTTHENFAGRIEAREIMPQEQDLAVLALDLQGPPPAGSNALAGMYIVFEEIDRTGLENTFDPITGFNMNPTFLVNYEPVTIYQDNGDGLFDINSDAIARQAHTWIPRPYDLDGDNQMEYICYVGTVARLHPLQPVDDYQPDFFVVIRLDSGQFDDTGFEGDRRPIRFGTDFTAYVLPYVYEYDIESPISAIQTPDPINQVTDIRPAYVLPDTGEVLTGVNFTAWGSVSGPTLMQALAIPESLDSRDGAALYYIETTGELRPYVGMYPSNGQDPLLGFPGRLWNKTVSINDDLVKPISAAYDIVDTVVSTSRADPTQMLSPQYFGFPFINPDPFSMRYAYSNLSDFDEHIDAQSPPTCALSLDITDLAIQGSVPQSVGETLSSIRVNLRGGVGVLMEDIDDTETEFNVRTTAGFPHHGSLQIDDEFISYANIPEMYLARDLDASDRTIYVTMNYGLCDYLFPGKTPEDKFNEFPDSGYLDINGEIVYYEAKGNWVGIDPLEGDPLMSYGTFVSVQRGAYGKRPSGYPVFTRVRSLQIQGARRGAGVRYDPLEEKLVAGTVPASHLADKIVACATPTDLFKLTPDMVSGVSLWMDNKQTGNIGAFDPIIDYMIDTDGTASTGSNFNPIDPDTDDVVPGYGGGTVQGERFRGADDIFFQDLDGDNEYSVGEPIFEDGDGDGVFSALGSDEIIYDAGSGFWPDADLINAGDINVHRLLYIDGIPNGIYDDGEDIFYDADLDGLYDIPVDIFVRLHPDEARWRFDQEYDHDNDGYPEGTFFMILNPTEGLDIANFDRYNQANRGPDFFVCARTSDSVGYNDRIQIEIPDYDQLDGRVPVTTPTASPTPIPKWYTRGFIFEDIPQSRWIPIPLEMVDLGEDLNYNGLQDSGEDVDNDGLWEPGQFFDTRDQNDEEESYDAGVQLTTQPSDDIVFFPVDEPLSNFLYPTHFRSAPGSGKMSSPLICNVPIRLEDLTNINPDTGDQHVPMISQPIAVIGLNTWDIDRDLTFPTQLFLNEVIVEFYDQDPQMPDPFPDFDPFSGDLRTFHKDPRRDCDSGIALYRDDNARTVLTRKIFPEDTLIEVESTSAATDDTGTATDPFDPPAPTHDGFVVNDITFNDDIEFIRIGGEWIAYTEMTETSFTVLDDPNTSEVEGRGLFGTTAAEHEAGDLVTAGANGWFDWFADDEWNIFVVDDPVLLDSHPNAPTTAVSTDPPAVAMLFTGTSEIYTPSGASPEPVPVNDIGINEGNDFFVVIRTGERISHGDDFTTGIVSWGYSLPSYSPWTTKRSRALGFADISPETSQQSLYLSLFRWLFHVDLPEDTRAHKTIETGALFADETIEPPRPTPSPTATASPTAGPVAVLFARPWVALNPGTLSQYQPVSQLGTLAPGDQISLGVVPTPSAPYTFTLLLNNSGAAPLQDLSAGNLPYQSVLYTAGPLAGVADIVRVEDSEGKYTDVVIVVVPEQELRVYLADGEGHGGYQITDGEQISWEAGADLLIWAEGGELPYTFIILVNNSDADLVTTETDGEFVLKVTYTPGSAVGAVDTIRVTDATSILYDPDTFITFTVRVVAAGSLPAYVWGDVNGDGQLTQADALLVAQIEAGLAEPASIAHAIAGDVDGDGRLTILDALYIRKVLAGEVSPP